MAQSTFSRRARRLFAAALSLSAAPARAQETTAPVPNTPGSTCGALVTPPHAAKGEPAVTGSALNRPRWLATRSLRYLTEQAVDVVIADVNPFLQQVRVRSTAEPIVETGLVAFIKIAFGLDLADVATSIPGEQTAPATPTDRRELTLSLPNPCARSRVAIVELGTRHNLDVRLARDLVSGVNATASAVKKFESVLAKEITVLHSDTAGTKSVARAACSADELLRSKNAAVASAVRPLKARTAALFTEVSRLRDATLKELAANPDCPSLREVVHAVDAL